MFWLLRGHSVYLTFGHAIGRIESLLAEMWNTAARGGLGWRVQRFRFENIKFQVPAGYLMPVRHQWRCRVSNFDMSLKFRIEAWAGYVNVEVERIQITFKTVNS